MPTKELWDCTVRLSIPLRGRFISPIFFKAGFPNLVCGCTLEWWRVKYHFRVTVTLTLSSEVVFLEYFCPGISLLLFEVGIPNLVCACISG